MGAGGSRFPHSAGWQAGRQDRWLAGSGRATDAAVECSEHINGRWGIMMRAQPAIRLATTLGMLSILGLLAAFLALTDIGHGEPDLTLEWTVLRVAALAIVAFHVAALWALRRAARALRE